MVSTATPSVDTAAPSPGPSSYTTNLSATMIKSNSTDSDLKNTSSKCQRKNIDWRDKEHFKKLTDAVSECCSGNPPSLLSVAKRRAIPQSTLQRHVKKFKETGKIEIASRGPTKKIRKGPVAHSVESTVMMRDRDFIGGPVESPTRFVSNDIIRDTVGPEAQQQQQPIMNHNHQPMPMESYIHEKDTIREVLTGSLSVGVDEAEAEFRRKAWLALAPLYEAEESLNNADEDDAKCTKDTEDVKW